MQRACRQGAAHPGGRRQHICSHPARAEPCSKHAQQALLVSPGFPDWSQEHSHRALQHLRNVNSRQHEVPQRIARLMREFYGCYLLQSQGEKCKGRTYIG